MTGLLGRTPVRLRIVLLSTTLCGVGVLAPLPALAAGGTENWNVASGSWFTAGNWDDVTVPNTGDAVNVTNAGTSNIDGGFQTNTVGTLTINGGSTVNVTATGGLNATTIAIGGGAGSAGTLNVTSAGFVNGTTGGITLNNGTFATVCAAACSYSYASTTLWTLTTFTNAIVVNATTGTANVTINGGITGAGGITFSGNGTVTLAGGTTYTGTTAIGSGATLALNGFGTLSLTSAITDNGSLTATNLTTAIISKNISGTGSVTLVSGFLTLNGTNSYSGATNILAGKLTLNSQVNVSPSTTFAVSSGATLDLGASLSLPNLTGAGTVLIDQSDPPPPSYGLSLTNANFTGTISQNAGKNNTVTILTGGNVILAGSNNWTGATTINAGGTLTLGNGGTGGNVPSGTITDNGALVINHSDGVSIAGLSGTGTFTQAGTGTVTFTGANTLSGNTNVNSGVLNFSSAAAFGTGKIALNGGTLQWATGTSTDISSLLALGASGGTLDTNGNNVTLAGVITGTGAITKAGVGVLTLTGANTYSGGTTIAGGTLSLGNSGAAGTGAITTTGSVIDYANGDAIANAIVINSNTTQLQVLTGTATQSGIISELSGPRPLEKIGAGTLVLTGANTYTGATTVTAGTLQIGAGGTAGSISSSSIIDNATLAYNRSDSVTYAGVVSGTGALTQSGAGTLTLTGINTYTGATTVNAGTLQVGTAAITTASVAGPVSVSAGATLSGYGKVGALSNGGTVTPGGGIGTLTAASYTQASAGKLSIEVSPTSASQLKVTGAASLSGTLALVFDPGVYTAKTYAIVTGAPVTGTFAAVTGTVPTSGLVQSVAYLPTEVDLVLAAPAPVIVAPTNDTIYTALTSAGIEAAQNANMMALGRLSDRRGSRNLDGSSDPAKPHGADLWIRGSFTNLSANASSSAPSYAGQNSGVLAGVDWAWGPQTILGVDAGYGVNTVSESTQSTGALGVFRLGAYGGYGAGPLTLDATIGWATDTISANRPVAPGTASSSHGGTEFTAALKAGYALAAGDGIVITPNAGLNYVSLSESGIAETGAAGFDLTAGGRSTQSARPFIGIAASHAYQTGGGADIVPQLHIAFSSELSNVARNMTVTTASGANFAVVGVAPSRDMIGVGAGVSVQTRDDLALTAGYDALLFSNVTVHTITAGLQYRY